MTKFVKYIKLGLINNKCNSLKNNIRMLEMRKFQNVLYKCN